MYLVWGMYISRPQILGLFDRIEIPQPTLFRHNEIRGGDNGDNDGEASQTAAPATAASSSTR